jgi:hypothetical protein
VTYFAEKHVWPNYIPDLIWELYPRTKELFLVRDFRDMARSIMAFDAKRGYPGFRRPDGISDEDYMRDGMGRMVADLRRGWHTRGAGAHLVRYEDLIRTPQETVTAMLRYLELDASPPTVHDVLAHGAEDVLSLPGYSYEPTQLAGHRTKSQPEETIGRWQAEGDDELRALAQELFGEALRDFGYA